MTYAHLIFAIALGPKEFPWECLMTTRVLVDIYDSSYGYAEEFWGNKSSGYLLSSLSIAATLAWTLSKVSVIQWLILVCNQYCMYCWWNLDISFHGVPLGFGRLGRAENFPGRAKTCIPKNRPGPKRAIFFGQYRPKRAQKNDK